MPVNQIGLAPITNNVLFEHYCQSLTSPMAIKDATAFCHFFDLYQLQQLCALVRIKMDRATERLQHFSVQRLGVIFIKILSWYRQTAISNPTQATLGFLCQIFVNR